VGFLTLSAFIGITVGDLAWLGALQTLGARRVIVVDTLKPFLAAVLGAVHLYETLTAPVGIGIAVTSVGVLVVSLERETGQADTAASTTDQECVGVEMDTSDRQPMADKVELEVPIDGNPDPVAPAPSGSPAWVPAGRLGWGYMLAVGNVVLDAYGALLVKRYATHMSPWDICLVRFGSAFVQVSLIRLAVRALLRLKPCIHALEGKSAAWCRLPTTMPRGAWARVVCGILFLTFLCPAISNFALLRLALGLSLTLGSLGPIYALPLVWLMKGERVTVRAVLGSALAVAGVAILCQFHRPQ
jgi:drug/metabolite transporter (DMT)-like permease